MLRLAAATVLTLCLLVAPAARAADRFVTTSGDDTRDCTAADAPCLTVGRAVAVAAPGDRVVIGPGVFTEPEVTTATALTLQGAGSGTWGVPPDPATHTILRTGVVLHGGGAVNDVRIEAPHFAAALQLRAAAGVDAAYDVRRTVAVGPASSQGGPYAITIAPSTDTAVGVRAELTGVTAVAPNSANQAALWAYRSWPAGPPVAVTLRGSRVSGEQTALRATHGPVVEVEGSTLEGSVHAADVEAARLTVRRSVLRSVTTALFVHDDPGVSTTTSATVEDSLLHAQGGGSLLGAPLRVAAERGPLPVAVRGSTLVGTGTENRAAAWAWGAGAGLPRIELDSTLARATDPADVDLAADGLGEIVASHSSFSDAVGYAPVPGSGSNLDGDPGLRDVAAADFALRDDSPLIDRGAATTRTLDLAGLARAFDGDRDGVAVPDVGAYECTTGACAPPPPPPPPDDDEDEDEDPADPPPDGDDDGRVPDGRRPATPVVPSPAPAPSLLPAAADTVAPRLSGLSAARTRTGRLRVRWTLTEAARVTVTVQRLAPGRRRGARCVAPARAPRGRRCTQTITAGSRTVAAPAGTGTLALPAARLRNGSVRLRVTAIDAAGNRAPERVLTVRLRRAR